MLIGIISDTHDNVENIIKAVKIFEEKEINFIIHCGDVIAPLSVQYFNGIHTKFVKGNCDGDVELLKEKIKAIGGEYLGDFGVLSIENLKIAVCHGKDKEKLGSFIESGKYNFVLHGHTHQKRDDKMEKTRVINPGAHYYQCENTVAILDVNNDKVEFIDVSK